MMKKLPLFALAMTALTLSWAKSGPYLENYRLEEKNAFHSVIHATLEAGRNYLIDLDGKTFTGVSIRYDGNQSLNNTAFRTCPQQRCDRFFKVYPNEHIKPTSTGQLSSSLTVFEAPTSKFYIKAGSLSGKVELHLLNAGKAPELPQPNPWRIACDEPMSIPPSVWRDSLPSPIGPPDTTIVAHVIVHHSAGSNTDTNYVNVIRNIYLYHTQTNGWDDIGYNFVIAQDGTLFQGRDDWGVGNKDNIQGAHFCGKNTGTMGICMLGNYMTAAPTESAKMTLKDLMAWKLRKEELFPFDEAVHPIGTGSLLAHAVGHRDGCSTLCPGDSMYMELDGIKTEVHQMLQDCGQVSEAPLAATDLQAAPYGNMIQLNWTDNATTEDMYEIQRSYNGNTSWTFLVAVPVNSNSYQDQGLDYNTTYYYRVRPYSSFGNGLYSNEAGATTEQQQVSAIPPVLNWDKVSLYPNPALDRLYCQCDHSETLALEVKDIRGVTLQQGYLQPGQSTIDISALPVGILLLELSGGELPQPKVFKLIKQ